MTVSDWRRCGRMVKSPDFQIEEYGFKHTSGQHNYITNPDPLLLNLRELGSVSGPDDMKAGAGVTHVRVR